MRPRQEPISTSISLCPACDRGSLLSSAASGIGGIPCGSSSRRPIRCPVGVARAAALLVMDRLSAQYLTGQTAGHIYVTGCGGYDLWRSITLVGGETVDIDDREPAAFDAQQLGVLQNFQATADDLAR